MKLPNDINFDIDFSNDRNARLIKSNLKQLFNSLDDSPTNYKTIMVNLAKLFDEGTLESLQHIVDYLSDNRNVMDLMLTHDVDELFIKNLWKKILDKANKNRLNLNISTHMNNYLKQNKLLGAMN